MCTRACEQVSEDRSQRDVFAGMLTEFVLLQHGYIATVNKLCMIAPIFIFCVNHRFLTTCMCSLNFHVLASVLP
jgi:hypothetical protein